MKNLIQGLILVLLISGSSLAQDSLSYAELSVQLIENLREGKPTATIQNALANVSEEELRNNLDTEAKKKAFWLNVYNAYVQILLNDNPDLFKDRDSIFGYNFFSSPQITIAEKDLSLDDIEHGIIRRSKVKISGGYANNPFPGSYEKKFRWDVVDPRIHFALNCGAAACPFIAAYEPGRVNEQLDITTKQYLEKTTDYYPDENRVVVNKLMSWFRADFGGKKGAVKMLKEYEVIPQDARPSIEFKEYDWTLDLGNYKDI